MTLKECTDKYGALNMEEEIIEEIQKDLERGGLLKEFRTSRRRKLLFYISKDTVFAVAPLPDKVKNGWTVMDRDIYDENFADGRGSLSFVQRNDRHYRVVAHLKGNGQIPLHRLVMRKKYDEMLKNSDVVDHEFMSMFINNSDVVDHEFMSTFINTKEALRFATYSQNCQNSRRSHNRNGEFAYNPDVDFTDTWYLYVLHKMLDMGTWKEVQEYNGRIVSAGH